jgi:aureolysin
VVADRKYPAHVSDQILKLDSTECGTKNDRCWVHFNSTIPSHASYLIHEAIGRDKAQTLYYLTLIQFLTSQATFSSAAHATMEACATLFDTGTCDQVKGAFEQVGML